MLLLLRGSNAVMLNYSVFGIIVVLSLSHLRFSESSICCTDEKHCSLKSKDRNVIIRHVTANVENASVPCPDLRDAKNITLTHCEEVFFNMSERATKSRESPRFEKIDNNTGRYLIDRPRVNDTGLYSCTVFAAPAVRTNNIFLVVEDPAPVEGRPVARLVLYAGCMLLAFYSLTVTTVTIFFAWKLKCAEAFDQSDYINTKPGEFRRVK